MTVTALTAFLLALLFLILVLPILVRFVVSAVILLGSLAVIAIGWIRLSKEDKE